MKIQISKNSLLSKLRVLSKIVKPNNVNVAYGSFLFTVENEQVIKITGSDETGQVSTRIYCTATDVNTKPFMVEASKLMAGLKDIPEQPITIEVEMDTEKIRVLYSNRGKFELALLDATLYPTMKEIDGAYVNIYNSTLKKGFDSVIRFTAKDELRPLMAGVNMSYEDNTLTFAGTNANVLSMYEAEHPEMPQLELNIPAKYAKLISDVMPDDGISQFTYDDRRAEFKSDDYVISYRLLEGKYPNFRAVIPQSPIADAKLKCSDLTSAVSRVSIFASEVASLIAVDANNDELTLTSEDLNYNQNAQEIVKAGYVTRAFKIGFNGLFMVDILKVIEAHDENVILKYSAENKAAIFTPAEMPLKEELTIILMPLMING